MKKSLFLIFILGVVLNSNIFANDTYFFTSGGNLHPTTEKDISTGSSYIPIKYRYKVNKK